MEINRIIVINSENDTNMSWPTPTPAYQRLTPPNGKKLYLLLLDTNMCLSYIIICVLMFQLFIYIWINPSTNKTIKSVLKGLEVFEATHTLCTSHDILTTLVFPRLDWASRFNVELTCKQWRLWCKYAIHYPLGHNSALGRWILRDIYENDGRELTAWSKGTLDVQVDGFPKLYKEYFH